MDKGKIGRIALGAAFIGLVSLGAVMLLSDQSPSGPATDTVEQIAHANPAEADAALDPENSGAASAPNATSQPDQDDPFVIKRILPITEPIKYGEWHWNDEDVPDGPIVITVDLDARVLSIFRGGYEIGATAVLLGTQEKPTPVGVYPITQKKRHHVSNLYDAKMPYMQRLTDDGITLHASEVEWGYASHGCIGMPETFAAKVFKQTKVGDRVFITRGKMVGIGDSLVDS